MAASNCSINKAGLKKMWVKLISRLSFALSGVMKVLLLQPQAKMAKSKFGPEEVCFVLS